ncbi:MAG TPA: hypothetical protein EYP23_00085 [Thermoplasmata archaeon]|nr:hypothetical protein [Thermoplasmata archaeon]
MISGNRFPPRPQPLYDPLVKNHNNYPVYCYVEQTLTTRRGDILLASNESYTLKSYKPPYPPMNTVIPFFKGDLMFGHPEFKAEVFNVHVELFVPEMTPKTV